MSAPLTPGARAAMEAAKYVTSRAHYTAEMERIAKQRDEAIEENRRGLLALNAMLANHGFKNVSDVIDRAKAAEAETERQAKERREDHEPANGICTCQFPNECLFEAGYKAAPVENVRLRFRLQACKPRGECPVCGGESDHVDTCEVGMLSRETERLRELLSEVAIPSLRYCEEKYDHDDQARLNLEAGLRRAALAPDHKRIGGVTFAPDHSTTEEG